MKTLILLLSLLAFSAHATDGDVITAAVDVSKGSFYSVSFAFCDTKLAANSTCAEFDLNVAGRGMPDYMIFSRDAEVGCIADPTIAINGQTVSGGTEHVIGTLSDSATSIRIQGPRKRFIDADITDNANCTDLTVNLTLFFLKR